MTTTNLRDGLAFLITLILSLSVHEYAHAWSAWRLGDDTASRAGRLTLNPLAHIDLVGTLLIPIARMFLPGVPLFGWAKPVPVNPARFRRGVSMPTGMLLTSLAGPLSNLLLAILSTVALALLYRFTPGGLQGDSSASALLQLMMQLNVSLAIFNLIPIPPLDGSRIVEWLLPYRLRPGWDAFCRMSPFLLLLLFYAAPYVLPGPMRLANQLLDGLFLAIVPASSQVGMQ